MERLCNIFNNLSQKQGKIERTFAFTLRLFGIFKINGKVLKIKADQKKSFHKCKARIYGHHKCVKNFKLSKSKI